MILSYLLLLIKVDYSIAGNYYLCDNGYANSDGFLTPFKGVRYHLKEWGPATEAPQSPREIFNMRHTRARNVIERAFAVLKMRWGILRSAAFYPVKVQIRLIMACFLLHNYVRGAMLSDPIELAMDGGHVDNDLESEAVENEFVDTVEPTTEWNTHRDALAQSMWNVVCFFMTKFLCLITCVVVSFGLSKHLI